MLMAKIRNPAIGEVLDPFSPLPPLSLPLDQLGSPQIVILLAMAMMIFAQFLIFLQPGLLSGNHDSQVLEQGMANLGPHFDPQLGSEGDILQY